MKLLNHSVQNCRPKSGSMCETLNISDKYFEKGDVLDSKIRKFFFKLRDKEIERDLRVTIRVVSAERIDEQRIIIDLTNDSNCIFLFTLIITKTDFDILRNDQGINVDFKDFPSALVKLLEKCAEGTCTVNDGVFKLVLEDYCGTVSGSCLMDLKKLKIKILEECSFKNMCHLSLDIFRGSEMQIQHKLEMEIIRLKQCFLQENKLHDEALRKISELVEEVNERNSYVDNLNRMIDDMKIQYEEGLRKERMLTEDKERQLIKDCEEKIVQEKDKFQKKLEKSRNVIQAQNEDISKMNEKLNELGSKIVEKVKEIEITTTELTAARLEISQLKNQNAKLDSDYHDREKTVNILRTRLAVAEQELKDNNILLLNHQKKLDEASKEKSDLQNNLDFIKSKLEKKESVVQNLSEDLIKGNEIISKQQSKITILQAKLKSIEINILEKEKLIDDNKNVLEKKDEIISKLQKEVDQFNLQFTDLNDKLKFVENDLKNKNEKLETMSKVITIMKENMQSCKYGLKSNPPQKSLIFYRSFLSTPSLLPSDDCRRINELKVQLHEEDKTATYKYNSPKLDSFASKKLIESSNIIEPYLKRYLRRYSNIPLSLFRSSNVPVSVLLSPDGVTVSKMNYLPTFKQVSIDPFCNSEEKVMREANEYLKSYMPGQSFPSRVHSESSISLEDYSAHPPLVASCSTESNNACVKNDLDFRKGNGYVPYEPVGGFKLRTKVLIPASSGDNSRRGKMVENCLKPSFRKLPAVAAPPLTRKQREGKESTQKGHQIQLQKSGQKKTGVTLNAGPSEKFHNVSSCPKDLPAHVVFKKTPGLVKSSGKIIHASVDPHISNKLKKNQEEPEPSAYFMG